MKKEKFFAISKKAIRNCPSVLRGDSKRNRGFFLN